METARGKSALASASIEPIHKASVSWCRGEFEGEGEVLWLSASRRHTVQETDEKLCPISRYSYRSCSLGTGRSTAARLLNTT